MARSSNHFRPDRRLPALVEEHADLATAVVAEAAVLERPSAPRQLARRQWAEGQGQCRASRRVDTGRASGRLEQRQTEGDVLGDVPVLEGEDLAPEPARDQLRLGTRAVEPLGGARLVVVRRELV